jgi:hypothetical protein
MTKEPSTYYKLGETKTEIPLDTAEENKNMAISLAKQARHCIEIFTQDLDAEIYNNKEFEQSIFKLAKRHPNTGVRILVQDSKKSVENGHCLVRLAQSLTSSVYIHTPSAEYKNEQCAFMVVDQIGLMHRISTSDRNYKANVNFMSPRYAGKLLDFFNEVWQHSTPDTQTRRIFM